MIHPYDPNNPVLLNSEILLGSLEAAAELRLDLSGAQDRFGIDDEMLHAPKGLIAFHRVAGFLESVAQQGKCPLFGFMVGKHQPPLRFGPTAQMIKLSPTLEAAVKNGLMYSRFNSQESLWHLERSEGYVFLKRLSRIRYDGSLVQLHTLAVTLMYNGFVSLCGHKLSAAYISFRHSPLEDSAVLERHFGAPVHFNQDFDGLAFPESYLQYPLATADAELFAMMKKYLDSVRDELNIDDDIPTKVSHHIRKTLGTSICNLESIAQLLGQHPRNLQRSLKQSDLSFRQLLQDTRQEVAEYYLRSSTMALTDLADILGYQNVSAFSRAFKSYCGLAPAVWREQASRAQ